MSEAAPYKNYRWLVADPELLGGKPVVRGTRLSVSFLLTCLADGMSLDDIEATYGTFPREAIPEVLKAAADAVDVAA